MSALPLMWRPLLSATLLRPETAQDVADLGHDELRHLTQEQLEALIEATGGFTGPVQPAQRALSIEIDRRLAEEER